MRMEDPIPQYMCLVDQLKQRRQNLAYLHLVTPSVRVSMGSKDESQTHVIHELWAPHPVITTGGYDYDRGPGLKVAEETGQLVGYGTRFLANPNLLLRLRENLLLKNLPLNAPDFSTFFARLSAKGYTD